MDGFWLAPERLPKLAEGAVHVWRLRLDDASFSRQERRGVLDRAYAALTVAERDRAARMRAVAPREEFVAGRGCLRLLLGAELEQDPRTLVLEAGEHGKPRLRDGRGLELNVSHSRGLVLLALSRAGAVGLDTEYIDAAAELSDVARTAFHAADLARIERAPTQDGRLAEFYRCWTRKEAVLKADGRGLTDEMTEFSVGGPAAALAGKCWFLHDLEAGLRHRAAWAIGRKTATARLLELSPQGPVLFAQ